MPEPRRLRNAPITEAIIDVRVKARPEFRPEVFADLKPRLSERFPNVDEHRGFQATFQIIPNVGQPAVTRDLGLQGYFFKSADGKTIAQFRVDGFTLNRLHPYTSWEELFPQAMDLWGLYSNLSDPEVITRLAVRYVNRIVLPSRTATFETYLRTAPVVPPELPQEISGFLTRVTIHDRRTGIAAHVAQALELDPKEQQLVVIFDIDAFKQNEFEANIPAIEETFRHLREFKNEVFFNSLTEAMLSEFE